MMSRVGFSPVLICLGLVGMCLVSSAEAQRFGGRGGRGSDLISYLRSSSVREELGVSDEQYSKLEAAQRSISESYGDKFRNADSDEARSKLSDERRAELEAAAKKVLSDSQFEKANTKFARQQQISLQRDGAYALERGSTPQELGLTDGQREQISKIMQERREATSKFVQEIRDNPEKANELRQKFKEEWDPKVFAVLTPDQRTKWAEKIGPPATQEELFPGSTNRPTPTVTSIRQPTVTSTPAAAPVVAPEPKGDVLASFRAPQAEAAAEPKSAQPAETPKRIEPVSGEKRTLSFNFRFAPWEKVLPLFADEAGLTLDIDVVPPGTFSYYDDQVFTATEALDILNGYLLQKGYILVKRDRFLVVVKVDDGVPPHLVPSVPADELEKHGRNELMRVIFTIEGQTADEAAKEINEILGPLKKVVALNKSSKLIVTDIGANLRRAKALLDDFVPEEEKETTFKQFPLKYIDAGDAESLIRDLLGLETRSATNVSAGGGSDRRSYYSSRDPRYSRPPFFFGGSDRGSSFSRSSSFSSRSSSPSSSSSSTSSSANSSKSEVKLAVDYGTNSLLVLASTDDMAIVEEAIKAIDVEANANRDRGNNTPYLHVYTLTKADPQEASKTLSALYPDNVVNEDTRNGMLHIMGTPDEHEEIGRVIRQLDGDGAGQQVAVIPLIKMTPADAVSTLNALFVAEGVNAPTVEADSLGRRILIRASAEQLAQIKTVLAQMGEDGTGELPEGYDAGPIRTIPLGGRDPQEVVKMLERMWGMGTTGRNPIRIVVPSQTSPVRQQIVPSQQGQLEPTPGDEPPAIGPQTRRTDDAVPVIAASQTTVLAQTEPQTQVKADAVPENQPAKGDAAKLPVMVTISGGDLVLLSDDSDALDQMESLIQMIAETMPVQTAWTVFYLTSADATSTATMLEKLFPDSSVSSASSSAGGMGGLFGGGGGGGLFGGDLFGDIGGSLDSLLDSPMTLRIIPETRSNALFVSGPAHTLREVEDVLRVLDASELPHQLRERTPRPVEIHDADVNDVYKIVSELYKDDMQSPTPQQQQGGNPIAAMFGGGGRGGSRGGNSRGGVGLQQAIKLTLSVDTRTNTLWVGANDSLYKQIESLVVSLDEDARKANRTVRIVNLAEGNAAVVQGALTSLMPKVVVSSSSGRRASTSQPAANNNNSNNGNNNQSQPNSDQMRQFFEQRMRERMQQQRGGGGNSVTPTGRGGSPFGGRGGSPFGGRGGGSPFGNRGGSPFGGRGGR